MPLPNPSMSFTPFDILTAEELNDLVENIEAVQDGTAFDANTLDASILLNSSLEESKIDWTSFIKGSGYIVLDDVQICWGSALASTTGTDVPFARAFASTPIAVTDVNAADSSTYSSFIRGLDADSVTIKSTSGSNKTVYYIAIGAPS